jgi:GntR family transcriptional repressor for pyruvate dehydrogenase complex
MSNPRPAAAESAVIRPPKTAVMVAHALADRVAHQEPGSMLPPERELLGELKVARGTLREALRLLELQGLVTVKTGPRGGPVVMLPDHRPLTDTLSLFLQSAEATFSEVVDARRSLESELARLAALHADSDDIAALHASIAAMEAEIDDDDFFWEENIRFHQIVGSAARNEVLRVFHSCLKAISDGHAVGVTYGKRHRRAIVVAHERITAAIEAGDAQGSYDAMTKHMDEFQTYIERHYRGLLSRRIRWLLPGH